MELNGYYSLAITAVTILKLALIKVLGGVCIDITARIDGSSCAQAQAKSPDESFLALLTSSHAAPARLRLNMEISPLLRKYFSKVTTSVIYPC